MTWVFTPLAVPLLLSAFVCALVGLFAWRRRGTAGGLSLVVLTAGASIWALSDALTIMSPNLDQYMFWWKVSYVGIIAVPPAWLVFALDYSGSSSWTTRPRLAAFATLPAISLILVWTESLHGLMWTVHGIDRRDPFIFLDIERGPWFWVSSVQAYSFVLVGAALLTWLIGRSYRRNRYRALALILLTVALPTGVNLIQAVARVYGYAGLSVIDLTPYTFVISIPAIAVAIFRYRVQDLAPVARDSVIEQIQDGIILIDTQFVVLDVNAAGVRFLDRPEKRIIGRHLGSIAPRVVHLLNAEMFQPGSYELLESDSGPTELWYDVRLSTIADEDGAEAGFAIVVQDISERKRLERQLAYQAHHDGLTGLANRMVLEERLEQFLRGAARPDVVALAFIDLDGFKEINDRQGHQSGDQTLKRVARRLLETMGDDDVVARWGGDEFAALTRLPSVEAVDEWGSRLLAACEERSNDVPLAGSIGIALAENRCPSDWLIRRADAAMYEAKRAGKHRFCVAEGSAFDEADPDERLAS